MRNRVTEDVVEAHLVKHGYRSGSIRFDFLELVAIQRPGWVQVFKFIVDANSENGETHTLHGAVRDDERWGVQVVFNKQEDEAARKIDSWSEGLITLDRRPLVWGQKLLLGLFAMLFTLAIISAIVTSAK